MTGRRAALWFAGCGTVAAAFWIAPRHIINALLDVPEITSRDGAYAHSTAAPAEFARAATLNGDALNAERAEMERSAEAATVAPSDAALPTPGHVVFHVVDARSGQPLEAVRIRFLNDQRFAEYGGGGDGTVALTPGRWSANVAATGYEPALLADFDVREKLRTELDPVALREGSGAIAGCIVARHLAGDQPVQVELFGDGRAPCEACRAEPEEARHPDACCGYHADADRFALVGDRRFRFDHLAAGVYWLRAFEPEQRIVDAQRVEIGRGGDAWIELEVSAPITARFELRHERGALFSGDWTGVHTENSAPITFSFRRNGKVVGEAATTPTTDDVLASVGPPLLPRRAGAANEVELSSGQVIWSNIVPRDFQRDAVHLWINASNVVFDSNGNPVADAERVDRARQEGDQLAFDFAEPEVSGVNLAIDKLRPDEFAIRPLPRHPLSLVVTCGHYVSDEIALDLRFDPFAPIVIGLHPTDDWRQKLVAIEQGPATSCTACHATPDGHDAATQLLLSSGDSNAFVNVGNGLFRAVNASEVHIDLSARNTGEAAAQWFVSTAARPESPPTDGDH